MSSKHLHCSIGNPVSIFIGDKNVFKSGCKAIDVTFPNILVPQVSEIHFKNFYTAFVTVKAKFRGHSEDKWLTCIRNFRVMPDPHCETGAQSYTVISRKHMSFELINVTSLRLILQQPSPVWKEFGIEEVKFYKSPSQSSPRLPLPSWLTDETQVEMDKPTVQGVPDITELSSGVQQLWSLAEHVAEHQPKQGLGRYDVDGCYEINLLSYN